MSKTLASIAAAVSVAAVLITASVARADVGVTTATAFVTHLGYNGFARVPSFAAYHNGDFIFRKSPPPANRAIGDLACDAVLLMLYEKDYDLTPKPAGSTIRPDTYWGRLKNMFAAQQLLSTIFDCRIDDELLAFLKKNNISPQQFARDFAAVCEGVPQPMFSIPYRDLNDGARLLVAALRKQLRSPVIGVVLDGPNSMPSPADKWDFVVVAVKEEPLVMDNALMPLLHSRYSKIPVLLALEDADFFQLIRWRAQDAAGFYFAAPEGDSPEARRYAVSARNYNLFAQRLPAGETRMMPELVVAGVDMVFGGPGKIYCAVLTSGRGSISMPHLPGLPDYIPLWYDPATDQNIALPRAPHDGKTVLPLNAPTSDPWIYCHFPVGPMTDAESTVTEIMPHDDEDELELPEDAATTATAATEAQ